MLRKLHCSFEDLCKFNSVGKTCAMTEKESLISQFRQLFCNLILLWATIYWNVHVIVFHCVYSHSKCVFVFELTL